MNINYKNKIFLTTNYFNEFISFAKEKGVKPNYKDIQFSKQVIDTQVKAYIARNVFDNDGFYPIIKDIDNTLLKAEKVINDDTDI